jgi:hypothetical protein
MVWLDVETKFSKTAYLAIMQQNILVKEQINITTPFYDEISKYSQSILVVIVDKFRSYKCKKYKTKTKNIYLQYFVVA